MDPFIGQIILFAGNFAPRGWAFCDGQLLPISQNSALFAILGTTYGGDGITTFALPDLRGRVAINPRQGPGLSDYRLGESGGTQTNTLTTSNLPAHSHTLNASNQPASTTSPDGAYLGQSATFSGGTNIYGTTPDTTMAHAAIGNTGGNIPVNNLQPFLCVNFIIALVGVFPSRG